MQLEAIKEEKMWVMNSAAPGSLSEAQESTERVSDLKSRSLLPNILLHFWQQFILTIVKLLTIFT